MDTFRPGNTNIMQAPISHYIPARLQFCRLLFFFMISASLVLHFDAWFHAGPEAAEQQKQEFSSVEERRLYQAIQEERANIREERKEIELRKKELKSIEEGVDKKLAEIDNKLNELQTLRKKIEALLAEKAEIENQSIQDLAKIYEKMDPRRAALAITELEPKLATKLLAQMKTKSAAKILDAIPQEKATELSRTFSLIQIE